MLPWKSIDWFLYGGEHWSLMGLEKSELADADNHFENN